MEDHQVAQAVTKIERNVSEASTVHEASTDIQDIHAMIDEQDIGAFYATVRQNNIEADMFRDDGKLRGFLRL